MIGQGRASPIYSGLPPHGRGQRIGLMGGSFNPAHDGHRHIALLALRRLQLDRIWWLVTPGNPLKSKSGLPAIEARMAAAARVARHPRIAISGAEAMFGTVYTADLIRRLKTAAPAARFVWVIGSDNLGQLHRWDRWQQIAASMPLAVVNRPGALLTPLSARAAQALRRWRIPESAAPILAGLPPPAWCYLMGPRNTLSSTALRRSPAS